MIRRLIAGVPLAASIVLVPVPAQALPVGLIAGVIGVAATSFVATAATFVVNAAISIGLNKLLAPRQKQQQRQAAAQTIQLGEQPRAMIIGEAATAGALADAFNYGGTNGTDWEVLIITLADHRCEALTGFWVQDQYVPFTGDGAVPGFNNQLHVWWMPGIEDQVLPSVVTTHAPPLEGGGGPSWTASDNLAGIGTVVVAYKADEADDETPTWAAGRPTFLWVVRGALLYDPRLDSTVPGGSGAHRWSDPSTRQWTDNLILGRYNWVRGVYASDRVDQPEMLLVGRGLSAIEAPPQRIFAAANVADELVALAGGGTERRYRANGIIYADESFIEVEERFAAACGGIIIQPEGGVEVLPGQAQSVVAEITDDDLLIGSDVEFEDFRGDADEEWINTVVPRYVEPALKWSDHAAPVRRVTADVIADRKPREVTRSMNLVTSNTQAQRCGEIQRRLGRLPRTATIPLGPRFAGLEEGDWIGWTSARRLGGARVVFRIERWSMGREWTGPRALREISAGPYSWNPAEDEVAPGSVSTQQPPPPPVVAAPDPVTLLAATPRVGEAELYWRNPGSPTFDHSRLYRGVTSNRELATEVEGPIYGGLLEDFSVVDTAPAGTHWWFVRTFNAAETSSSWSDGVSATVT